MTAMNFALEDLRNCMDGVIPGSISTCAADGMPNVSFLSNIEFVDPEHVALSFQFFNKTRENILQHPFAELGMVDPYTGATYRLQLQYLRTETEGPIFERMKAKLSGVASHEGMTGIFKLRGSDIYRVLSIDLPPGDYLPAPKPRRNLLAATRCYATNINTCHDLDELLEVTLRGLHDYLGIKHAMILMLDSAGQKLFTVGSHGYETSGAGAEIPLGQGIIGVAARERCPIRISFIASDYSYGRAIRESLAQGELAAQLETTIPFAGLPDPHSQIAVPIMAPQKLLGVLYADSHEDMHFSYEDEDMLMVIASQLGSAIASLPNNIDGDAVSETIPTITPASSQAIAVRHFAENDSVFLDDAYLIKGIAGSILWTLLNDYVQSGRKEFTNRGLRLDPRLRFPDINDNLEARLILLQKRLLDRDVPIQLEKTGRGRFALNISAKLELHEVPGSGRR
ncbi:MAG: GAF domain-containing protein [Steroidobacteraceae bacterium]